ncbi:hypothetical protein ONA70_17550 [Micromonospora yasonensis]|uniref:hypothetical protein n=1 Tax=Micromonospora yasonensis TaxID=1128667 RepID=UPI0022314834|nr:hypothetical protein [Micromonospora yasonensis]MCW3841907.1 hypothetical protein [Micromonospora yasonensis]
MAAGAVAIAWVRRTAPPWPAVAGNPYEIPLGPDGCPIIEERRQFVDTPGPLVPPGATEVLLCTTPTALHTPRPGMADPPRQRVLRGEAADFASLLNRLPSRNQAWRQWQRRHSGWWPDTAPEPMGEVCLLSGYSHEYSFVLRYPDRPPVPLIYTCGGQSGGLTSGIRTRMDDTKPHLVDEFLDRFQRY